MIFAGVIFVLAGIGGMVIGFLPFPEAVRNALPFPAELFRRLIPAGVTALIFGIVLLRKRTVHGKDKGGQLVRYVGRWRGGLLG